MVPKNLIRLARCSNLFQPVSTRKQWDLAKTNQPEEEQMPTVASQERPPIDPYPLSPYVTWAGNRNRDPILQVFKEIFPKSGHVLELASGGGGHINYFAPLSPKLHFHPPDYDVDVFEPIKQKRADQGNSNVADPIKVDLTAP